ncbi:MAG TPA: hypothetical protein H9821_00165 [Candidatus Rothia avicola]|uniref:Uncharacterized protein n=1 Tax=Candidatus Rothia avicola TaxID=2840478 RepID=A0A9D1ZQN1_9MICC|nr:hypothetical protein [Candidatus Rothia avicola]
MTEPQLTSSEIAKALHTVFDSQIINYGAYNLVFATGSSIYRNPDLASHQEENQSYFLIGYRDTPREAVIAPLSLPEVRGTGTPTSIDNTNAARTFSLSEFSFGLESTNGTSFSLTFEPHMTVQTSEGSGVLDQALDIEDFKRVIIEAWEL